MYYINKIISIVLKQDNNEKQAKKCLQKNVTFYTGNYRIIFLMKKQMQQSFEVDQLIKQHMLISIN